METTQLEGQDIFQLLRPEQVNLLSATAEEFTLQAGDTVFRSGEPADDFFVILKGRISLRLPRPDGMSLLIDDITDGAIFGSCVCFQVNTYTLSAACTVDSRILKIRAATLKKLMDDDPIMGYAIQTLISRAYFKRYVDTMQKLQSILRSIPLEAV